MKSITVIKELESFRNDSFIIYNRIKENENLMADNVSKKMEIYEKVNFKQIQEMKKNGVESEELKAIDKLRKENDFIIKVVNTLKESDLVLNLAADLKEQDLKNNIKMDLIKVLIDLKLYDKNLTDLRKEKIIKKLYDIEAFNKENVVYVYNDRFDGVEMSLHIDCCCYSSYLKIWVRKYDIEAYQQGKMQKKEILTDDDYMQLASKYYEKKKEIEAKRKKFLDEIAKENSELKEKYSGYYISSDFEKEIAKGA